MLVWYLLLLMLQLFLGAVVGWWFAVRQNSRPQPSPAPVVPDEQTDPKEQELRDAMSTLKRLTSSVQDDVRAHTSKVDTSQKALVDLSSHGEDVVPAAALAAIAPIIEANEELQKRLTETEQKLADQAKQLDEQTAEARTDPLTSLLNRRGMEDELGQLIDEYEQTEQPFCVILLDIDHFKKFNDRYGHDIGDLVLKDVARMVLGAVRTRDVVARFGGEEFVILLGQTEMQEAQVVAEQVRLAIEAHTVRLCMTDNPESDLSVKISLGVAQVIAEDQAALLKRADLALYAAKHAGRNRSFFHDGLMTRPVGVTAQSSAMDGECDELTRLPGLSKFSEEMGRRIAEASRYGSDLSIIVLEVDDLAGIADEHDERTANLVRRGFAAFLTQIMRDMDLVARINGDCFSVMLPTCSLADAARVAERVCSAAQTTPFQLEDCELNLTVSVGVASAALHEAPEALIERSQQALEHCQKSGGNSIFVDEADSGQGDDAAEPAAHSEEPEPAVAS